jgi:hypothetical protein
MGEDVGWRVCGRSRIFFGVSAAGLRVLWGIVGGDCKCIIHHTGEGTWQARACLMSELNDFTSGTLCKV